MTNTWALVPVKALNRSKSRLGTVLAPQECAELSRAMLVDVLNALHDATRIDRVAVLTNDSEVALLTERAGHLVIDDATPGKLSTALNAAARHLTTIGATTVVIIPSDIPTINGTDIDQLLADHSVGLSVCSASRDGGTNALVCSPPDALPFQFGADSARRHLACAADASLPAQVLTQTAFDQDIDTPADLLWLSQQNSARNSIQFLKQVGIAARLSATPTGAIA